MPRLTDLGLRLWCHAKFALTWGAALFIAPAYYFFWGGLWLLWLALCAIQHLQRWACPIWLSPRAIFAPLPNWSRFWIGQLERAANSLNRWTSTYGPVLGLWAYNWVANLPVIQFVLLGTQWGVPLQKLYTIFPIGDYWIRRLRSSSAYVQGVRRPDNDTSSDFGDLELPDPAIPIQFLGIQLTGMFIQRVDFVIRFVFGLIYGAYVLERVRVDGRVAAPQRGQPGGMVRRNSMTDVPILLSMVGYMDMPDNAVPPRPPARPDDQPQPPRPRPVHNPFVLKDAGRQGLEILSTTGLHHDTSVQDTAKVIQFLVEAAWLSYEEPLVAQDVVLKLWAKDVSACAKVKVLDFVSTVYKKVPLPASDSGAAATAAAAATSLDPANETVKEPEEWERPLDTQCLIFVIGNAIVLGFRGSQPGSILDWFYDFSVNSLAPEGTTGRPMGGNTAAAPVQAVQGGGSPSTARSGGQVVGRMHEGFRFNLGLPKLKEKVAGGDVLVDAEAVMSEVYEWPRDDWATTTHPAELRNGRHPVRKVEKSPYDYIKKLVLRELEDKPDSKLYVTGHSLGGALCAVFASTLAEDLDLGLPATGVYKKRVFLATYGQPLVGDKQHSEFMEHHLPGNHYLRVVNLNDLVGRVPTFFLDSGASLAYAGQAWFINSDLQLQQVENIPAFDHLLYHAWAKLQQAWQRLGPLAALPPPSPQSSLRFLVRAALTPIMVINDHIDYKWVLRNLTQVLPPQPAIAQPAQ